MTPIFSVLGLGSSEIILILAVVLLLFGAKKLPELAKGLGQGIKEFKRASNEVTDELHRASEEPPSPRPQKTLTEVSEPHSSSPKPLDSSTPQPPL